MKIVQVNYAWDRWLRDPDALLDRYRTLTGWSAALAAAGARVTVVQRFESAHRRERGGVEYVFGPAVNRMALAAAGDLVHVNGLLFDVPTWLLRRRLPSRVPIVMQDHSAGEPPGLARGRVSLWRRRLRRRALRAVDAFLFAAAEQGERWRRERVIAPDQPVFEVMEAGTSIKRIDRAAARRTTGVTGTPAVLWVGRLNANKDPLTVLDGFERALQRLPAATLTMVFREDDLLPAVARRIGTSKSLRDRVRLVGCLRHDDVATWYSAADLFVLGSHHEGSGFALLEACGCGAIPLVTDIPSFRVITAQGAIGRLWTPGDAASLATSLVEVARRDLAAESARVTARTAAALSWDSVAARALRIYDATCRRRAAGHPSEPQLA